VLGVICVLLLIAAGALIMTSGPSEPGPTPTFIVKTPTPGASPSAGPTDTGTATTAASPSGSVKATPTPRPTQSSPTASITFSNMMLDASDDPARTLRTFTFISDGPGLVSATITSSTGGSTKICITVDLNPKSLYCPPAAVAPKVAGYADTQHSIWTVTLVGKSVQTPTVDVTISWPSSAPSITLAHARFQGAPAPNSQKGFTATFKPRGAGQLLISAGWPGLTANAQVTLADVTGTTPVIIDDKAYSDVGSLTPVYSTPVVPSVKYQVLVLNTSPDSGRPDMNATISFP
jgi:hypothetical protein